MQQDSQRSPMNLKMQMTVIWWSSNKWQTGELGIQPTQLGGVDLDALRVVENEEDLLEGAAGCGVEVVADGLQDDLSCCLFGEASTGDREYSSLYWLAILPKKDLPSLHKK